MPAPIGRKGKLRRSPSAISRQSIRRDGASRRYDPGGANQFPTVHGVERSNTMLGGDGFQPRKSPWEVYNDKAALYDREMLKEWDDNLSILLVFAALFSGVLTTFIIGSMNYLTPDNQDTMVNMLQQISLQLANNSTPAYQPVDYKIPDWAVRVNFLFFASLGCSLLAALASVLALQWIRDYDIGLVRVTIPRERALRRHLRFEGAQKWFMPEIIAILPTLLHISLLLFLGGIMEWLLQLHFTVAITMIISLAFSTAFYVLTQTLAAIWPSAPFRTPLSRFIETNGAFIYSQIHAIYHKLRPAPANTRKPMADMAALSSASGTTALVPRFREKQIIESDVLLPSSALTWLLGHVELSGASMPYLRDIFEALIYHELPSTMAQKMLVEKAAWTDIFEWLTRELSQSAQINAAYPVEIDSQFFVMSQLSAIVGSGTLQIGAQKVLRMNPFSFPNYQIGAQGVAVRFTLWKNGQPFPVDATGPPLKLLLNICQHHIYYSRGFLITSVREMTSLLEKGIIPGIFVIVCLTTMLTPRNDNTFTEEAMAQRTLRLEIISAAITAIEAINGKPVHRRRVTKDEDIEELLDLYLLYCAEDQGHPREVQHFFVVLAERLVTFVAATFDHPMTMLVLPILRHKAIRVIWGRHRTGLADKFLSRLLGGLDFNLQSMISSVNLMDCGFETTMAAVVLQILSILPQAPASTTIEFRVLVEAITTLAVALQDDEIYETEKSPLIRFKGSGRQPRHEVPFSITDPFPWFNWVAQSVAPSMVLPDFAFIISLLLSAWSRYLFDTKLFSPFSPERMSALMEADDKLLIFASCVLMGWDFGDVIPDANAYEWEETPWKLVVWHWASWPPFLLQEHDMKLLDTLSRQPGEYMKKVVLSALENRTMRTSSAETIEVNSTDPTVDGLISIGIKVFNNMSTAPYSTFSNVLNRWSEHPLFKSFFIEYGGCEWLATRAQPDLFAGVHLAPREVFYVPAPINRTPTEMYGPARDQAVSEMPISILLDLFKGPQFDSLSAEHCQHLLNTSIICDFPNDMDAQADTLSIIKALRNRLTDLSQAWRIASPRAASYVAQILNEEILLASAGGYGLNDRDWNWTADDSDRRGSPFAGPVGSLYEWIVDTKGVLEDLRGVHVFPRPKDAEMKDFDGERSGTRGEKLKSSSEFSH